MDENIQPQEENQTAKLDQPKEEDNFWYTLGLTDDDTPETAAHKIQEKIGLTLVSMQEALSKFVQDKAEEITLECVNIAPLGDYSKLIEDNDGMAEFLKTEGHKPEHWSLHTIRMSDVNKSLIVFMFMNKAVDAGDTFKGFVFVTKTGKIKHSFAQVND